LAKITLKIRNLLKVVAELLLVRFLSKKEELKTGPGGGER